MTDPLVPFRRAADPDAVGRLLARAAPAMKTPSLGPAARARILGALPHDPLPPPSRAPWLKVVGLAGVGAVLVAGVALRRSPPAPVVTPAPAIPPIVAPVAHHVEEPVVAPVFSVHDLPTAPPVAPPVTAPSDTLAREVALLDRAHASSDPSAALALLDEHARTFPNGSLGPEREVFAVEALLRAGRRADAEARGAAFVRTHAGSAHAMRIERLLR